MLVQVTTIRARRGKAARPVLLAAIGLCVFGSPAYSQTGGGEPPGCSYDLRIAPQAHLLEDWCGERKRLEQRGVQFDFQYVSDTLWGFKSQQNSQFASGTVSARPSTSILAS
jgi:porin